MKKIFIIEVSNHIFPGFYNTPYDPSEDEGFIDEYYKEYTTRIVENVVNYIKSKLPNEFIIKKHKLVSPKTYNYKNDKIELYIEASYEDILYKAFNYDSENLFDYIDSDETDLHETLLELYIEFIILEEVLPHELINIFKYDS